MSGNIAYTAGQATAYVVMSAVVVGVCWLVAGRPRRFTPWPFAAAVIAVAACIALASCGEKGCLTPAEVEQKVNEIASGVEISQADVEAKQAEIQDVRERACE